MARTLDKNTPFSNNAADIGIITNSNGRTPVAAATPLTLNTVGAAFSQTAIDQAFSDIAAKLNVLIADYNRNT